MKKHKIWVGLFFSIFVVFAINILNSNVEAADPKTTKCVKENFEVSEPEIVGNEVVIRSIGKKKGIWEIKLDSRSNPSGTYILDALHGSGEVRIPFTGTVEIGSEKKAQDSSSVAVLKESDGSCNPSLNKVYYKLYAYKEPTEYENDNYNGVCKELRDWAAANGATDYASKSLNYCYNTAPSINYTEDQVRKMANEIRGTWELLKNIQTGDLGSVTQTPSGFESVTDVNLSNLKCDAFNKAKNEKKYSYTKTVKENKVCKVVCREDLTVIYDAPIAAKAGFCFTYTVEVKSKVTCATELLQPNPPTKGTACVPEPVCVHKDGKESPSGGPNEDFDACVQKCDNGKYTQKCVNKCYKKVYGKAKSTSADMLSYEGVTATKMANSCGALNKKFSKNMSEDEFVAAVKEVQKAVLEMPSGHYKTGKNGKISWVNERKDCYWSHYGMYYFSTLDRAKRTITHDSDHGLDQNYGGVTAKDYTVDNKDQGFKKAYDGNCSAKCTWTGCKGEETNQKEIDKQWEADMAAYKSAIAECNEYSKCESKTTTFNMSVLPSNDEGWINYEATNSTNSTGKQTCKNPNGDAIINTQSGTCYGVANGEACGEDDENDYRTVINFPGTWRYDKLGTFTYTPPKSEVGYTKLPNQFCPSHNFKNVNTEWWAWDLGTTTDTQGIESKLKYNIKASAKNFGLFKWNIDIKCFYAMYNGEVDKTKKVDPKCDLDSKDCVTTDITSYTYKAAALDELFAGSKETTDKTIAGRETGWNWSCDATDLTDKNYPIAPTALISDIQTKGDEIYKNDAEYLDYQIELTPADINEIKRINKQQKNFLDYTGNKYATVKDPKNVEPRSVYKSALLDQLKQKNVVKVRYTETIGCNNREGTGCLNSDMIDQQSDYCLVARNSLGK